jgi:hypothetical protein
MLPHLSHTLNDTLPMSRSLLPQIRNYSLIILPIAAKLCNALLFRECMLWLVSKWPNPEIDEVEVLKLWKIVLNVSNTIGAKVCQVQHEILSQVGQSPKSVSEVVNASNAGRSSSDIWGCQDLCFPDLLNTNSMKCSKKLSTLCLNYCLIIHLWSTQMVRRVLGT